MLRTDRNGVKTQAAMLAGLFGGAEHPGDVRLALTEAERRRREGQIPRVSDYGHLALRETHSRLFVPLLKFIRKFTKLGYMFYDFFYNAHVVLAGRISLACVGRYLLRD